MAQLLSLSTLNSWTAIASVSRQTLLCDVLELHGKLLCHLHQPEIAAVFGDCAANFHRSLHGGNSLLYACALDTLGWSYASNQVYEAAFNNTLAIAVLWQSLAIKLALEGARAFPGLWLCVLTGLLDCGAGNRNRTTVTATQTTGAC